MKKLLFFLAFVAFTLSVSAQRSGSTTVVGNTGLKNLTMTAADTVTQAGTVYWVFDVNRQKSYLYAVSIAIDTVAHTNNRTSWTVWGSMDNTNWVASGITQLNIFATDGSGGTDTTFVLSSVTTGSLWRYLKVRGVALDNNVKGCRVKALGLKAGDK